MTPRGRRLTDDERETLVQEARALPRTASLRQWCEERASLIGCHPTTIYRAVRDVRSRGRKRRADAGKSRLLDEQVLDDLAAMVVQFDYDAELALDTLNANRTADGSGTIDVHPETLRRHLREMGVSRRHNAQDLRVHRRWEAPRPGWVWQLDSTVAQSWYIDVDDTVGYEAPVKRNKTKAGNGLPRIWLIGIVDDHTRVRWARFYTANDALAWRDCLIRAMRGFSPDLDEWPAFGIPERVYSDQDSAMKSAVMTRMLEVLGIERMLALPSTEHETNAQAKGKVERALGVILHGFEKTIRMRRLGTLRELNGHLYRYLLWLNNRRHSGTGEIPFERWLNAAAVKTLPAAEIMAKVLRREETRTVSPDLSISLEGKTYQLPRRAPFVDLVRSKVTVAYHPADLTKITLLIDGQEHEIDAVEALPDEAGEFKQAETPAAVEKKRELLERDLSHIDPHVVHDYRVERDPRSYPIRPPTTPHEIPDLEIAPAQVRLGKAIDRAQRAGVMATPPTEFERAAVQKLFAGRREVPEPELAEWIESRRALPGQSARDAAGA